MRTYGYIVIFVMLVLAAIAVVAVSGGLLVLLAYGVGKVINLVLDFDPFQATLLSLAAIVVAGWVATRIMMNQLSPSITSLESEDDDDDDDDDDDSDTDSEDDSDELGVRHYETISRWRLSSKQAEFLKARPDDRCPCGSGRKFKNCHGAQKVR